MPFLGDYLPSALHDAPDSVRLILLHYMGLSVERLYPGYVLVRFRGTVVRYMACEKPDVFVHRWRLLMGRPDGRLQARRPSMNVSRLTVNHAHMLVLFSLMRVPQGTFFRTGLVYRHIRYPYICLRVYNEDSQRFKLVQTFPDKSEKEAKFFNLGKRGWEVRTWEIVHDTFTLCYPGVLRANGLWIEVGNRQPKLYQEYLTWRRGHRFMSVCRVYPKEHLIIERLSKFFPCMRYNKNQRTLRLFPRAKKTYKLPTGSGHCFKNVLSELQS